MSRRYNAYLLRCWLLADGRERVEIRHLPSGESHLHSSLADASTWLRRHGNRDGPAKPDLFGDDGPEQEAER